jgi:hypothetical protein
MPARMSRSRPQSPFELPELGSRPRHRLARKPEKRKNSRQFGIRLENRGLLSSNADTKQLSDMFGVEVAALEQRMITAAPSQLRNCRTVQATYRTAMSRISGEYPA